MHMDGLADGTMTGKDGKGKGQGVRADGEMTGKDQDMDGLGELDMDLDSK